MNKARVESFSDGVFAFAITLLVLGVQVPELAAANDEQLRPALLHALGQLVPYLTSFATIGIIWLNHHRMFHSVERVEHTTLTLNLLLLLVVAFIPYPTAVLGRYGALPSSAFLYGAVLTLLGITYTALSIHIQRKQLSRNKTVLRSGMLKNFAGTFTYPAATLASLRYPRISVTIYFLLAFFYFLTAGRGTNLEEG
jgi:uncharacterized membrane protein